MGDDGRQFSRAGAEEDLPYPAIRFAANVNARQQQACRNLMTIKAAMGRTFHGGS
jgi:hypothetical protein